MWNGVVTNAGLSLLEMWAAGGETLYIDRATAGTGTVAQDNMRSSTHVQGDVGAVPIVASIPVSSGTQYRIQVQPSQTASYILRQLGIWAHLGDNGASTLLALYQDEDGVSVPLEADDPGFNFTLYAIVTMSNQGSINVNYDSSAYVTRDALDEITDGMIKTVNFGGQVYTGDYAGSISIPVDAQPTENSLNTVKSGGTYDAIAGRVAKSGDTMTGDLTATNIIAQASSGNPSFYINNGSGGAIARIVQRGTTGLRFRVYKTPGDVNVYEDFQLPFATTDSTESYPIITAKGGETIRNQLLMASTSGISDSNDYKRLYFCDEDGNQLAQQIFRASTRVMYFQIKDADGSNYLNYTLPAVDSIVSENTSYRILTMKPGGGFVYGNGDTYSTNASYVAPLVGYVGAEGKVIYFTVPVTGDMSSITSISVTRLAGAIRTCESKFIADKSSSSYDWTNHSGLTITVQKVASNLARILMTFTSAPTNATENAVVCGAFMVTLSFSAS